MHATTVLRRCTIAAANLHSSSQSTTRADDSPRAESARKFAIDAARHAANTRCNNVVVLDVRGLSPVCDYFVLATGTSARQMRTVADEVAELGEKQNFAPLGASGLDSQSWMLVDFVDVLLHVFSDEAREYYDLDNLWGDAKRVDWNDGAPPRPA